MGRILEAKMKNQAGNDARAKELIAAQAALLEAQTALDKKRTEQFEHQQALQVATTSLAKKEERIKVHQETIREWRVGQKGLIQMRSKRVSLEKKFACFAKHKLCDEP